MKISIPPLAGFVAGAFLCATPIQADEWNQKIAFTFSAPVEIPGRVLIPGTYVFKLVDDDSADFENVVAVYNRDQSHLIGMFLTVPDQRLRPAPRPLVTFEERPVGTPEAIDAWFYPGHLVGHEFIYPRTEAMRPAHEHNRLIRRRP